MKSYYLFFLLLIASCSGKNSSAVESVSGNMSEVSGQETTGSSRKGENKKWTSFQKSGGYTYRVSVRSALAFLEAKGEKVAAGDRSDLAEEGILVLEIQSPENGKDFFESRGCLMDKADAYTYLSGEISGDLTLLQGQEELIPAGCSFERSPEGPSHIRILFFMGKMDFSHPFTVRYNDRLSGQGRIQFQLNTK